MPAEEEALPWSVVKSIGAVTKSQSAGGTAPRAERTQTTSGRWALNMELPVDYAMLRLGSQSFSRIGWTAYTAQISAQTAHGCSLHALRFVAVESMVVPARRYWLLSQLR